MEYKIIKADSSNPKYLPIISNAQIAMAKESENLDLDPETVYNGVSHLLNHPDLGTYYLSHVGDEVTGMCLILKEWSDWRNGEVWWIHSVYVYPKWRRQGVFTKLYHYLKDEVLNSTTANVKGLRLYVDKRNEKASLTYRKLGMDSNHYELFEWLKEG